MISWKRNGTMKKKIGPMARARTGTNSFTLRYFYKYFQMDRMHIAHFAWHIHYIKTWNGRGMFEPEIYMERTSIWQIGTERRVVLSFCTVNTIFFSSRAPIWRCLNPCVSTINQFIFKSVNKQFVISSVRYTGKARLLQINW